MIKQRLIELLMQVAVEAQQTGKLPSVVLLVLILMTIVLASRLWKHSCEPVSQFIVL